ncbi:unnamed protein product [Pedinophyceae sp. YPF-701]|nr:unnamed protein product [Pedinophyceae sp. YPF-701]
MVKLTDVVRNSVDWYTKPFHYHPPPAPVSPLDKIHPAGVKIPTASGKMLTPAQIAAMEVVDVFPRFYKGPYTGPSVVGTIGMALGAGAAAALAFKMWAWGEQRIIAQWYQDYEKLWKSGHFDIVPNKDGYTYKRE